jgi:hypothetical protein
MILNLWRRWSRRIADPHLDSAIAVLEALQRDFSSTHPWMPVAEGGPATDDVLLREFVNEHYGDMKAIIGANLEKEEILKTLRKEYRKRPPSRYQDVAEYRIIEALCSDIDVVCQQRSIALGKRPIFGSVQTGRVNGMAVNINNPKYYLILIEDGLFGFANLFAKCIVGIFPLREERDGMQQFSTNPEDLRRTIAADAKHSQRFLDVVAAYVVEGAPHAAKQYFMEPQYHAMQSVIRDAMELFVLGHEYGHCAAGHLEGGNKRFRSLQTANGRKSKQLEEIVPTDWIQEFQADSLGLLIALGAMHNKGIDPSLSYSGVEVVFSCINVIERALSILQTGEIKEHLLDSHPPSLLRREVLTKTLNEILGEERANHGRALARITNEGIDILWKNVEPIFYRMYSDGLRPHVRWSR